MNSRNITLSILAGLGVALAACNNGRVTSDAYGNFEAKEIIISAEATGKLVAWTVDEGDSLAADQQAGAVDTIQLYLKKKQLRAQRTLAQSKEEGIRASVTVQEQQRQNIETEKQRVARLLDDGAATAKQMDDVTQSIALLDKQIASTKTQYSLVWAELRTIDAQLEQVEDQLHKSTVRNPAAGTVLESYVEEGELVTTGKALYKIGKLSSLDLRAYVTGNQLSSIAIGQEVRVLIDNDKDGVDTLRGTISWVSHQAEFTPKTVQTRDERVNFVYAFKVKVPNTAGKLKIGMPGEVLF